MRKIIEEQKLTLSGILNESEQIEIGKLMSADYLVFGEIVDMVSVLLISVRMADVETGEIVWEDSLTEKLETYDYIGAYFARSILKELDLDVRKETVAKVEDREEKQTEAIVALSSGIDAYDRGDEDKAKDELEIVRKLDPENEVAQFYLSKMQALSPKFRVETPEYVDSYSPGSLGFIEADKVYYWFQMGFNPPWTETSAEGYQTIGEFQVKDSQNSIATGIELPLGGRFGLRVAFITGSPYQRATSYIEPTPSYAFGDVSKSGGISSSIKYYGGALSVGVRDRKGGRFYQHLSRRDVQVPRGEPERGYQCGIHNSEDVLH